MKTKNYLGKNLDFFTPAPPKNLLKFFSNFQNFSRVFKTQIHENVININISVMLHFETSKNFDFL